MSQLKTKPNDVFGGIKDVMEKLAALPSPQEVLALKASPELEARVKELLDKSRNNSLSDSEKNEWDWYSYAEHLVRMAKGRALLKIQGK